MISDYTTNDGWPPPDGCVDALAPSAEATARTTKGTKGRRRRLTRAALRAAAAG